MWRFEDSMAVNAAKTLGHRVLKPPFFKGGGKPLVFKIMAIMNKLLVVEKDEIRNCRLTGH
jgi:hypothetical protein